MTLATSKFQKKLLSTYRLDNIDSFHEKKMLKKNGWGIGKVKSDDISSKKKENIGSHLERIYSLGRK